MMNGKSERNRKTLKDTKHKKLMHTIGNNDPKVTILATDRELINNITEKFII